MAGEYGRVKVTKSAIKKLKAGDIYRINYGPGNLNNMRVHILANLEEEKQIVLKYWSYRKQRWFYCVESYYYFSLLFGNRHIEKAK